MNQLFNLVFGELYVVFITCSYDNITFIPILIFYFISIFFLIEFKRYVNVLRLLGQSGHGHSHTKVFNPVRANIRRKRVDILSKSRENSGTCGLNSQIGAKIRDKGVFSQVWPKFTTSRLVILFEWSAPNPDRRRWGLY